MLYHGTTISGLSVIKANSKSHTTGKEVAYFTEDRCYALICCRSKDKNFVTMGLDSEGKQNYYERFPNQLKTLYSGKKGYIYFLKDHENLRKVKGYTYESEQDVPVSCCEEIDDVYNEILKEEAKGNIMIHRYLEIDPVEQKMHANYIRDHLKEEGEEMQKFYLTHFSSLWDSF
ncbi:MAG: hypothetical protein K2N64_02370 [Anaeroplasmataceae bacterium]|nr:hypothetical protein [Anaeroplasmataceae bacterium]